MKTFELLKDFIDDYLGHEEAVFFSFLVILFALMLLLLVEILAPVVTGVVIAYVLSGLVERLSRAGMQEIVSVSTVFIGFVGLVLGFFLLLIPLLWQQAASFAAVLPGLMRTIQTGWEDLAEAYPEILARADFSSLPVWVTGEWTNMGGAVLETAFSQLFSIFGIFIYFFIVPFSVFFVLKDGRKFRAWISAILPENRVMLTVVAREMDLQLGNYIRGKCAQILIVGSVSFSIFYFLLDLNYSALLAAAVGLSVVVPIVGFVAVTFPVVGVALAQFGWSDHLALVMICYLIIQLLDAYVLTPMLFSEANDLHPLIIIVSVLVFGSIWGFWGVFFAIPMALLVKVIISAWPTRRSSLGVEGRTGEKDE